MKRKYTFEVELEFDDDKDEDGWSQWDSYKDSGDDIDLAVYKISKSPGKYYVSDYEITTS